MSNIVLDSLGNPVSSDNKEAWLEARLNGVTATEAGKIAANGSSRNKLLEAKLNGVIDDVTTNPYMIHGSEREASISDYITLQYNSQHNTYLYHGDSVHYLATPDGIGEDFVVEIKTSIKPLNTLLAQYNNQMQWQMFVMNVEKVLFVVEQHENFVPLHISEEWVYRDDNKILLLKEHADIFIEELLNKKELKNR